MNNLSKIPLLIADDHKLFAHSFAEFINNHTSCEVVAIAHDGKDLLQKLNSHKVDVVLLDINMPLLDGIEAARKIKARMPQIKIIAVSQYREKKIIEEAVSVGMDGYFVKNNDPDMFIDILEAVLAGQRVFDDAGRSESAPTLQLSADKFALKFSVTPREMDVLQLIKENCSNREIAERLFISQLTVETHTKNICRKLNTSDRTDVVKFANTWL